MAGGNLSARWPRAVVALIAVVLGVALVAAITSGYASARRSILDWNYSWVGHSDVHVAPIPGELWAEPRLPPYLATEIARLPGVARVVARQKDYLLATASPRDNGGVVYGYGVQVPEETQVRGAGIRVAPGGQMLAQGATGQVLLEQHLADTLHKQVGDTVYLAGLSPPLRFLPVEIRRRLVSKSMLPFTIIGIVSRPRFSSVKPCCASE